MIFASGLEFLLTDNSVWIYWSDMSSSVHIDNKSNDILTLGEWSTPELHDTTLTAETKYPINFTQSAKIYVLSLHYNESNSL